MNTFSFLPVPVIDESHSIEDAVVQRFTKYFETLYNKPDHTAFDFNVLCMINVLFRNAESGNFEVFFDGVLYVCLKNFLENHAVKGLGIKKNVKEVQVGRSENSYLFLEFELQGKTVRINFLPKS